MNADENPMESRPFYRSLHVQVGYTCQNDCLFCCDGGRAGNSRPIRPEAVRCILESNRDLETVVFTRREPTLNPGLVEYVGWARSLGYRNIILITNGRRLARGALAESLARAGVTCFGISVHGPTAGVHERITGRRRSFAEALAGIRAVTELRDAGLPIEVKLHTTVCGLNVDHLPALVDFALALRPDSYGLNAMFLSGRAAENADRLAIPFSRMVDAFRACLRPGVHLPISLSEVPPCAVLGRLPSEYIGYREDFHLAAMGQEGGVRRPRAKSAPRGFRHRPACRRCSARGVCDGLPTAYLERFGWQGLDPIVDPEALQFVRLEELLDLARAADGEWELECTSQESDRIDLRVRTAGEAGAVVELQISPPDPARPAFARTERFTVGLRSRTATSAEIDLARRVVARLAVGEPIRTEPRGDQPSGSRPVQADRRIRRSELDMLLLVPPDYVYRPSAAGIPTFPEENRLPYGPLALASYLRHAGQRVMVAPLNAFYQQGKRFATYDDGSLDSRLKFIDRTGEVLETLFDRLQPRTVGLSVNYALHHQAAEILLDGLRARWPDLPVLVGGNHATHTADAWLTRASPADGVVLGEGERTCLNWLQAGGRHTLETGMVLRTPDGQIRRGPPARPLAPPELGVPVDPALVALPRWSPLSTYSHLVSTGRGCEHRCRFCTSGQMWRGYRSRPPEAVAREVERVAALGARRILLADDLLPDRGGHLERMADVLSRFDPIRFDAPVRLEALDHHPPESFVRAGIDQVLVGLESFAPQVLRSMHKGLRIEGLGRLERTLEGLRRSGIGVTLFMLIGHPGSSQAFDMVSVERCRRLADRGLITCLSAVHVAPFPGTGLAADVVRGRVRVIEPRMNRWTLDRPVIELLDRRGAVSYAASEMRQVFEAFQEICRMCQGKGMNPSF